MVILFTRNLIFIHFTVVDLFRMQLGMFVTSIDIVDVIHIAAVCHIHAMN